MSHQDTILVITLVILVAILLVYKYTSILRRGDMSHQYTILVILVAVLLVYKYTSILSRGDMSHHTSTIRVAFILV